MERLTALSARFLSAEDVDPASSMVIGSFSVLSGPAPSLGALGSLVDSRLPLAPRYRQRIRRSLLGLRSPYWEDDPGFDVRQHVRVVALPSPGGEDEMAELFGVASDLDVDDLGVLVEGIAAGWWSLAGPRSPTPVT